MRILATDNPLSAWARLLKGVTELGYALDVEQAGRCLTRLSAGVYAALLLALLSPASWDLLDSLNDMDGRPDVLAFRSEDDLQAEARARALGVDQVIALPCSLTHLMLCLPEPASAGMSTRVQVRDLELDLLHRRARRQGRPVDLTRREFDLLALLAAHSGRALSRTWLVEQLWGHREVALNSLDVHIYRLREKLDRPFPAKIIETVRGVGYRLTGEPDKDG
ncbi:MAG: winged helix-turn-helix domain-containing protein [Gammaproteobacteria bacterium]